MPSFHTTEADADIAHAIALNDRREIFCPLANNACNPLCEALNKGGVQKTHKQTDVIGREVEWRVNSPYCVSPAVTGYIEVTVSHS